MIIRAPAPSPGIVSPLAWQMYGLRLERSIALIPITHPNRRGQTRHLTRISAAKQPALQFQNNLPH